MMAISRYTIEQLLQLRPPQFPKNLSLPSRRDPEIADVVRSRKADDVTVNNTAKRPQEMSKDSSSGTSEEVLYRGNGARTAADTEQTEWKYRGRSGSEVTATEPLSAPAGVNAQQNEGFQKFYRAVVSPNHVRVTAGGRIVPNTRGPPSPTAKRPRDRGIMDGQHMPFGPGGPVGAFSPFQMPPMMPPFFPGFGPAPSPLMPMAYGFPMPAVPVMHPAAAVGSPGLQSQKSGTSTLRDMVNTRPGETRAEQAPPNEKGGKSISTATEGPGQARPTFNGHWAAPPSNIQPSFGGPFMPLNMMANPNFPLSPMTGPMMHPPHMGAMVPQMGFSPGHPPNHPPMPGASPLASPGFPPPAGYLGPGGPPVSSIRPSEITRNQLQQLRSSLKYSQDQFQFNRHQIDEKFMEQKIKDLEEQTQRFESLLRVQIAHEDAYYPRDDRTGETRTVSAPVDNLASNTVEGGENPETTTEGKEPLARPEPAIYATTTLRKRGTFRPKTDFGINAGSGEGGNVTFKYDPNASNEFAAPIKKTGLSRTAALAPVFNPGSSSLSGSLFDGSQAQSSHPAGSSEDAAAARNAVNTWIGTSSNPAFTQPKSFGAPSSSHDTLQEQPERFGVPYLMGTLPSGLTAMTAVDTDYVYPRTLTQDELRARFLYWGRAPKSARRGLPKYDGKHFYPASPVKEAVPPIPRLHTEAQPTVNGAPLPDHREEATGFRYPQSPKDSSHPRSRSDLPDSTPRSALIHDGPAVRRFRSFRSQAESSSDDLHAATDAASAFDDIPSKSEGTSDTDASSEKKSDKYGARLWQAMLKKIPSSIAMSAATAQGSRSHLAGHGAPSLSPITANAVMSPPRVISPSKNGEFCSGGALLTPIPEMGDENRPPQGPGTLEEHFRALATANGKRRPDLSPSWK